MQTCVEIQSTHKKKLDTHTHTHIEKHTHTQARLQPLMLWLYY